MAWFLKFIDFDLWKVTENGYHFPTKIKNEMSIPKLSHDRDALEKRNAQLNAKDICFLHCALDINEYYRTSQCETTKDIWRVLEITHEETN